MEVPPLVGVVADDLTGSGDIGVMFAKRGAAVRILSGDLSKGELPARLEGRRSDVIIIDTDSRFDPAELAYAKVRAATRALRRAGCGVFYKKTCSVFRGNVGREFDAMLDELGESFGVTVAAFPKNGRITRDGVHYVHGRPLAESEFARDPVHPRRESNLVVDVQAQTRRRVGLVPLSAVRSGEQGLTAALQAARASGVAYAICDTETQDDLHAVARAAARDRVLLGSSALAEELARVWPAPAAFDPLAGLTLPPGRSVLVVAGSVMPQTQAQLAALADAGVPLLTASSRALVEDPAAETRRLAAAATAELDGPRQLAVVRSENWPEAVAAARRLGVERGLDGVGVSRRTSELLAAVAEAALVSCGRLIVLGGDTSAAVCRRLGVVETVVLHELAPGLPSTVAPGPPRELLLVLKSGSFGGPGFVLEAIEHLRGLPA